MTIGLRTGVATTETDASGPLHVGEASRTRADRRRETPPAGDASPDGAVSVTVSEAAVARLAAAEEKRTDAAKLERLREAVSAGQLGIDSALVARRMLPSDEGDAS